MGFARAVLVGRPRSAAGQRDKRVRIEQAPGADQQGGTFPVEDWTTLTHAWMNKQDVQADERFAVDQATAYNVTEWTMDYRADMDPDLVDVPAVRRLVYLDRTYDIRSASVIGRKQGIELVTVRKVG